ncbi:MAG: NAD+ synthase [Bryobacterales bacterium]|nr:NAD+ synthase [Bryobacterales bacterium]
MKIALGQINPTVGALEANVDRMVLAAGEAVAAGARLVVFPELSITGYPPQDLVEKPSFARRTQEQLLRLARETAELPVAVVCGFIGTSSEPEGKLFTNSAAVIDKGQLLFRQDKMLLPTYDVFDEWRYFEPAEKQSVFDFEGRRIGLTICEDAWNDLQSGERLLYDRNPVEELVRDGAELLISINASPFEMDKRHTRRELFCGIARRRGIPLVWVNQVGGNDQLVFDGSSFAADSQGSVVAAARSFEEDLVCIDLETMRGDRRESHTDECEAVYDALVLGTRDYIRKCGFRKVLVGLSGGLDSSLVAAIAMDAVGRENVTGIAMPGPYSSGHSLADARELAKGLGIRFEVLPITNAYEEMLRMLDPVFGDTPRDVTEENIQARLRGLALMSLSNKWGAIVLTTGNKSELAVGYCTLYGDMCGGLAVISDIPKTLAYRLTEFANRRHANAIPANILLKPPSAELRPDQKDSDSLPPYEVLDPILKAYVEDFAGPADIAVAQSLPEELVRDIIRKVDLNEYKRQQAAPGLKVTTKAFGIGRRFPIAQRYRE